MRVSKSALLSGGMLVLATALVGACTADNESAPLFDFLDRKAKSAPVTLETGAPLTESQKAFDVRHYTIANEILIDKKAIRGHSEMIATANSALSRIELDFDERFKVSEVQLNAKPASYSRANGKLWIDTPIPIQAGSIFKTKISYQGRPHEAEKAPWEGGFVWTKTPDGAPWVATAIQGEGCDIWWPCKDHPSEEAESLDLRITVPENLMVVANGRQISKSEPTEGRHTFHWHTDHATNDYGVAINIAPYEMIEATYNSINGTTFPVQFWHLPENKDKAQKLFDTSVLPYLDFYERKLGPYPWSPEKAGFVETPYYGMEHQTINAYGAKYVYEGYPKYALLHHELAHEWFGNKVTVKDWSDFWLHEGFATYMQPTYLLESRGVAAYHAQILKLHEGLKNCAPVAPRGEMTEGEVYQAKTGPQGDIYSKGALVLHSLHYLMGDEAFWDFMAMVVYDTDEPETLSTPLKALHRSTDDIVALASQVHGEDLSWFFEVYVREAQLPEVLVEQDGPSLTLSWQVINDRPFPMPIPIQVNGALQRVEMPGGRANLSHIQADDMIIDPEMAVLRHLPFMEICEKTS